MVKAIMALGARRESLVASDMQMIMAPQHSNYEFEELKRTYGEQNSVLARKNEELQMRVSGLEKQLFSTQKELLQLRNEKAVLNEKLQKNARRFNNVIVNGFETMMNEYREFLSDVNVDVEKRKVAPVMTERVETDESTTKTKTGDKFVFENYWSKVNDDLQRRKSIITTQAVEVYRNDDDQLDTLVEKDDEMEETYPRIENKLRITPVVSEEIAPEYEDADSTFVPTKGSAVAMAKVNVDTLGEVPFLGLQPVSEAEATNDVNQNDELFDYNDEQELPVESGHVEDKSEIESDTVMEIENSVEVEESEQIVTVPSSPSPVKKVIPIRQRKAKVPRELKNLDAEKTRRWTGVDFDDENGNGMNNDRRKSRRRSLVVNYQIPAIKPKNKRGKERITIFLDDENDKENNRVNKRQSSKRNTGALRNITNLQKQAKSSKEKSIFDLENVDMFGSYNNSKQKLSREALDSQYDMLL